MKIDPKIEYKSETGNSAFIEIESELLIPWIDGRTLEEMRSSEIISMLKYDNKHNSKPGVFIEDIPKDYLNDEDVKIYDPEYVKWLESKVQ